LNPNRASGAPRRADAGCGPLVAGGGDKPNPLWFRLLVALAHLRQGISLRATAAIFGIDEKSVRNDRDEIVR
jgi:hypothetical protein